MEEAGVLMASGVREGCSGSVGACWGGLVWFGASTSTCSVLGRTSRAGVGWS